MKLLTYDTGSGPRAGLLVEDRVVDVTALLGARTTLRDVGALLELGDDALDRLRAAAGGIAPSVPLASVRLRSPVLRPPTVRDFMDYEGHASHGRRMRGEQVPEAWYRLPVFYFSNSLCIVGPEDEVPHPSASDQLDYEVEIGAVIGRE